MTSSDTLLRAINEPETVRVVAALTTETAREACERQGATFATAVVIARSITAGVLLATLAKGDRERVRVQIAGNGPVGQVMIDAHGDGRVRACVSRTLAPTHLANRMLGHAPGERPSVAVAVGSRGHVVVTRDLGLATPYQGSVDIQTGEIDDDLEHYLNASEQLPSVLRTAVVLDQHGHVLRAAGVMAQGFPGIDPTELEPVRARLFGLDELLVAHARQRPTKDSCSVDDLVAFALGQPSREGPAAAGERGLSDQPFRRMLEHPVQFHCPCGPQRARSVLSTLGAADLEALANEQEQTEVRCNFCGRVTTLSAAQVRELAAELRMGLS